MISQDDIQKKFDAAPESVQAMVNSDEVFNAFHEIRQKYNLHIDEAGNLATAINATILEIIPFTGLDDVLKEGLQGVDSETRKKVIADVDALIFVPLREKARAAAQSAVKSAPQLQQKTLRTDTRIERLDARVVPPPAVAAAPAVPPAPSVLEQKLGPNPSPAQVVEVKPPTTKYHGTDPYRELAE